MTAATRASDAEPWVQIGEQSFSGLPHALNVGFAVSSHVDGAQAEAWFEQIALTSLQQPPSTWTSSDVGEVGAAGHSSVDEDSGPEFTVTGSGADVWGTADEFHFLWREVTGNFDFSARVAFVDDLDKWTKAGLMIRDGLSADARHAFLIQTPRTERGVAFQRRPVAGGSSVHTAGPASAPPGFLRLVRDGDVVTAYYKEIAESSWMLYGTQTFTELPATVLIGFAVSSHVDGSLATGYFDNFELYFGSATWVGTDVGDVGAAGHSSVDEDSGPEFTVTGSGADVWGTADEFHFLSREVVGDFDFSARAGVEDLDKWTKAGLMVRDGLAANARHAFIIQTPRTERGVAFQRRPETGGLTLHTAGPATAPQGFLRLVREGDVVRAYHKTEPAGPWVLIGTQTFTSLPATLRIGFAVSSHVDGSLATGHFDNLILLQQSR